MQTHREVVVIAKNMLVAAADRIRATLTICAVNIAVVNEMALLCDRMDISDWVPRRERRNGQVHRKIVESNWPELLEFPLNPDAKYKGFYNSALLYYIGVRGKYSLERLRRRPQSA
jgi:hypothetical protein